MIDRKGIDGYELVYGFDVLGKNGKLQRSDRGKKTRIFRGNLFSHRHPAWPSVRMMMADSSQSAFWACSSTTVEQRMHLPPPGLGVSESSGWAWMNEALRGPGQDTVCVFKEAVNDCPGSAALLSGCVWAVVDLGPRTPAETTHTFGLKKESAIRQCLVLNV